MHKCIIGRIWSAAHKKITPGGRGPAHIYPAGKLSTWSPDLIVTSLWKKNIFSKLLNFFNCFFLRVTRPFQLWLDLIFKVTWLFLRKDKSDPVFIIRLNQLSLIVTQFFFKWPDFLNCDIGYFFIPFWIQLHPLTSLKKSCSPLLEGGKVTLRPTGGKVTLPPEGGKTIWYNRKIPNFFCGFFSQIFADSKWNKITYLLFIVESKQNRKFSGNFSYLDLSLW